MKLILNKIYQIIRKLLLQMLLQIRNFLFLVLFVISKANMAFVFKPSWQNQGVGARVIRVIGNQKLRNLDPFLMLDYFHVKLPAGFPDHPHRGFETVTYMKQGSFYHQDFKGHKGKIGPGDIQWMTAGKGIVHSQIPASSEETSIGFQLWINLKSDLKMMEPAYQQYTQDKLPIVNKQQAQVKIICGQWGGQKGPIHDRTPSYYFDIRLKQNGTFSIPIKKKWNSIAFVYDGQLIYQGSKKVQKQHCLVMEKSQQEEIVHTFKSEKGAKFLLIGGQPIGEKVVQHGPFVMNTQQQIMDTFKDYQYGKNGFQNAANWESKIRKLTQGKSIEQL